MRKPLLVYDTSNKSYPKKDKYVWMTFHYDSVLIDLFDIIWSKDVMLKQTNQLYVTFDGININQSVQVGVLLV